MADLVFTADWHLGRGWGFRLNPRTGVSERVEDVVANVRAVVAHTIRCGAPLLLVGGDAFDRTHVRPYFREIVRAEVVEPLAEQDVRVILMAGNHDQPSDPVRGTSLDDFRGYRNVTVVKDRPDVVEAEGREGATRLVLLPYLHPELVAELVLRDEGTPGETREKVSSMRRGELLQLGRSMLRGYLHQRTDEAARDGVPALVVGHYFVEAEGIRVSSTLAPQALPGEFTLTPEVLPPGAGLSLWGHVHLHQRLSLSGGRGLVYCGSPERLDWGEYQDEKGFLTLEIGEKPSWEFHALPCRHMERARAAVPDGADPTEHLLRLLPKVKDALVRLELDLPQGGRMRLRDDELERALAGAFHYELAWKERSAAGGGSGEFDFAPTRLFAEYIAQNYHDHPLREELQREGEDVLREVLG